MWKQALPDALARPYDLPNPEGATDMTTEPNEPTPTEPVDVEENVMRELRATEPPIDDEALRLAREAAAQIPAGMLPAGTKERLEAALRGAPAAQDLIEGGPLGWVAPPIRQWPEIDPKIDEALGEAKKSLALYFPDWAIAVWPTAVPASVIEALRQDLSRPEADRLRELAELHTIQIEVSWMPDSNVIRRLKQGATIEEVGGPKVAQFIAAPFTCKGAPSTSEFFSHVAQAILDHGGVQKDPEETLAARKANEIADAVAVLKGHGLEVGNAPKAPPEMTLERWESMSEPEKTQWQREWAAWEAYRSPGPPPANAGVGPTVATAGWERTAPPGAPFVPPDAYVPGQEVRVPRGRPGLRGPNGAEPWAIHAYKYVQGDEPEYTTDPEVAMIEQLLASFQGWGRADVARVLDYVKARLVG